MSPVILPSGICSSIVIWFSYVQSYVVFCLDGDFCLVSHSDNTIAVLVDTLVSCASPKQVKQVTVNKNTQITFYSYQ